MEYANARYYNSSHGRFTSVDPLTASAAIKDPQSFNRYSYVSNSPYKFTDLLGLMQNDASTGWGEASANFWGSDYSDSGSHFGGRDVIDATEVIFDQQIERTLRDNRDKNRADSLWRQGRGQEAQAIADANGNLKNTLATEPQTNVTVTIEEVTVTIEGEEDVDGLVTEPGNQDLRDVFGKTGNTIEVNLYILNYFGINSSMRIVHIRTIRQH